MCGIAGIASAAPVPIEDRELLRKMCNAVTHRGPDDEGYHFAAHAGLGIRRLSIIDLQTGHQPVFNEDKSCAVILNGEIYNYRELRVELIGRGHQFATKSDTEAIVHLYEEYGDDCVTHLRGMFCFALWDENRRRLLLARDRVGIKQLYYAELNGQFLFGSEIKCLLQSPDLVRRIDAKSLAEFLTFLYIPAPSTIYKGIFELPPAHRLVWENGRIRVQQYWQLQYCVEPNHSENFYAEGLLANLRDAVRSHLISDVPLGAFLSGGIDSGILVSLMSQEANTPVETFTAGFEQDYGFYDERKEAALVARRYRTNHHEFLVHPELRELLPRIISAFDQPHADSSAIPNYYICQLAHRHLKVAISGMGGDEMAGGYERYLGMLLGEQFRKLPGWMKRALANAVGLFPDWRSTSRFSADRMKRFFRSAGQDPVHRYLGLLTTFNGAELNSLVVEDWKREVRQFEPEEMISQQFRASGSDDRVNQMLFSDLTGYLPGDLLPLTDRMSMVHSLEVRVPYLDHKLLEFSATIPPDLKLRGLTKKYILRRIGDKLLPKEILRREKRGFSVPLGVWLRNELRTFVLDQLSPEKVSKAGYFRPSHISALLNDHLSGRANHENKIWALLIFSLWHNLYFERSSCESTSTQKRQNQLQRSFSV